MSRLNPIHLLWLLILCGSPSGDGLRAQQLAPGLRAIKERLGPLPRVYSSSTRQFVVVGHEPGSELGPPSRSKIREGYMQMDPGLVVVSCERVKSELLFLFQRRTNEWESQITVYINGKGDPDMPVEVAASYSSRGWQIRLVLPGQMEKRRFVGAIVRALLMDVANRGWHGARAAEAPLWMREGIAAHLYAMWGPSLAQGVGAHVWGLDGPVLVVHRHPVGVFEIDYQRLLEPERRRLELFEPLSFSELQLPGPEHLEGYGWQTFQACAHVFVAELLKLKEGRKMLWKAVELLPRYRNGQLAFMEAFRPVFPTVLAADKWWSVALVDFKLRDDGMRWSQERTLARLRDILHVPVSVRIGTNAVPGLREMVFQRLVRETTYEQHRPILLQSVGKLLIMQVNSRRDMARLLADYRDALEDYLRKQDASKTPAASRLHKQELIERLDLLDGIRLDFKLVASPEPEPQPEVELARAERLLERKVEERRRVAANTRPIDRLLAEEQRRMEAAEAKEREVRRLLERERARLTAERERLESLLVEEARRRQRQEAAEILAIERLMVEERRRLEREERSLRELEQEIIRSRRGPE